MGRTNVVLDDTLVEKCQKSNRNQNQKGFDRLCLARSSSAREPEKVVGVKR